MNLKVLYSILFFVLIGNFCQAQIMASDEKGIPKTTPSLKERKVVFVIVDGIAADMLEKASTPNLDAISQIGAYSRAHVGGNKGRYSETPTISAVGYNSLLTGTWANKHNVYDNNIEKPNYQYPTIFKILKDNFPEKKTAVFSTWQDNRTKLLGENLKDTGYLKLDYAFDGFELDTIAFPHDEEKLYIKNIDKSVAQEAARYIKEEGPDLSWVYLQYTDDMGHKYGDGPQLNDAIEYEDLLVGWIWESILTRESTFNEQWLLMVTTDHGRAEVDGKGHGGQSDRERNTWIVTNTKDTNTYFKNKIPAIVDIMPTILKYMQLKINDAVAYEIDGIPLIGKTDLFHLKAEKMGKDALVSWDSLSTSQEMVQVYLATTNHFKNGGQDFYVKMGEVPLKDKNFVIRNIPSSEDLKIVVKSNHTVLNTWLLGE